MKLKMLGNIAIDMKIYKLYGEENTEENVFDSIDFWDTYISSLKIKLINEGKYLGFSWRFLDMYSKMIINILIDSLSFNPNCDNFEPVQKYQWVSRSYETGKFFKYVVDILIDDMKNDIFRKILITKNTSEFEKLVDSRLRVLGHDEIFNKIGLDDEDYIDYFYSKDFIWEKNEPESHDYLKRTEKVLFERLK